MLTHWTQATPALRDGSITAPPTSQLAEAAAKQLVPKAEGEWDLCLSVILPRCRQSRPRRARWGGGWAEEEEGVLWHGQGHRGPCWARPSEQPVPSASGAAGSGRKGPAGQCLQRQALLPPCPSSRRTSDALPTHQQGAGGLEPEGGGWAPFS